MPRSFLVATKTAAMSMGFHRPDHHPPWVGLRWGLREGVVGDREPSRRRVPGKVTNSGASQGKGAGKGQGHDQGRSTSRHRALWMSHLLRVRTRAIGSSRFLGGGLGRDGACLIGGDGCLPGAL